MSYVRAPHNSNYRPPTWATQPQVDRMKRVLTEHQLYDGHYDRLWKLLENHEVDVRTPGDGTRMTRETASKTIEWLDRQVAKLTGPQRDTNGRQVTITPGVFRKDGEVYVVKPNKDKTRVYATKVVESPARLTESGVTVDFELKFAPGVVWSLTEADRLPLAEAKDFMTRYGKCICCRRALKAAKSVELGIGPVCRKMYA